MPSLGWRAPDRKPYKLNTPIDVDLNARLDKLAAKRGLKKTELCREMLIDGLRRAKA